MFFRTTRAAAGASLLAVALYAGLCTLAAQDDRENDKGDTEPSTLRTWEPERDTPPPVSADKTVKLDYPIVYVRVPRPYPKEYFSINHLNQAGLHQTNGPWRGTTTAPPRRPGRSLVRLQPQESITDPPFPSTASGYSSPSSITWRPRRADYRSCSSRQGADIYKIHVPTRRWSSSRTRNARPTPGPCRPDGSHLQGVHNLDPCPVAGGKVVFVSDRDGFRGVREQTQPALQLFVMDDDGSNVEKIGHLNVGTGAASGRAQGRPDHLQLARVAGQAQQRLGHPGHSSRRHQLEAVVSALGSPPGHPVHFQTQLSDESIVVEIYYIPADGRLRHLLQAPPACRRAAPLRPRPASVSTPRWTDVELDAVPALGMEVRAPQPRLAG